MTLYVLIRRISPYTAMDLVLGVFSTLEEANAARQQYLERVVHGGNDPFAVQAYHPVSDADVVALSSVPQVDIDETTTRVFVVSTCAQALGQQTRKLEALVGSEARARALAEELETTGEGSFLQTSEVMALTIGELQLKAHAPGAPPAHPR